jgi:hypothetical protein
LAAFFKEHGHCRVAHQYKSPDGFHLGVWASVQRRSQDEQRKARLDALGFVWDPLLEQWEEGLEHLNAFVAEHRHCRVAANYKSPDGFYLGLWVSRQRKSQDSLSTDRKARLDALGVVWDPVWEQWEDGFEHLAAFVKQHGHCRVPQRYKSLDEFRLGQWVSVRRYRKDTMDPMRRQRLEALPGWSWDALSDLWEEGFSHLKEFSDREGHCRVFRSYNPDDGYTLGEWVRVQRRAKDTMDPMRRQRLEALPGWSWDIFSDQWEKGFSHLKRFSDREGHCRVPKDYKIDGGYRLGQWVGVQRKTKDTMEPDRRQRLETLPGWVWKVER